MRHIKSPTTRPDSARCLHRWKALSVAICALLGCSAAEAATHFVTSCADDGSAGTLRSQIAAAHDTDEIDLHSQLPLTCSTITLTQGEIHFQAPVGMTITGPSDRSLAIVGNGNSRLLNWGEGGLALQYLTLRGGRSSQLIAGQGVYGGGCIYSFKNLTLRHVTITDCAVSASGANARAAGGAIYALYSLKLDDTQITNSVVSSAGSLAAGGGVSVNGKLYCYSSSISHNSLRGTAPHRGGGADIFGGFQMNGCTIDSNEGGGINAYNYSSYFCDYVDGCYGFRGGLSMQNCTISGNTGGGGVVQRGGSYSLLFIANSTIVGNSGTGAYDASVYAHNGLTAQSSIFANNPGFDIYLSRSQMYGADNLVVFTNLTSSQDAIPPAPGVIVSNSNPRLAPLAYHGGITRTHALLANSPAIDIGNNSTPPEATDQRGAPRESPAGKPDIGAYERQPNDDEIFYDGFNSGP